MAISHTNIMRLGYRAVSAPLSTGIRMATVYRRKPPSSQSSRRFMKQQEGDNPPLHQHASLDEVSFDKISTYFKILPLEHQLSYINTPYAGTLTCTYMHYTNLLLNLDGALSKGNKVSCFPLAMSVSKSIWKLIKTWWRHQIETLSALLALWAGNSPVTGEFPWQRPVTQSFDGFIGMCLNKLL